MNILKRLSAALIGLGSLVLSEPCTARLDPPPATSLDAGSWLPDGVAQVANSITVASPFRFYSFHLQYDVDYPNVTFLDIDTEGSFGPMVLAIFDAGGSLVAVSEPRGGGPGVPPNPSNNAQLSFGVGLRAGVDNGHRYSGQEGDLPAGLYYLVIACPGSTFANNWTVNAAPACGTEYLINFSSNSRKSIVAPFPIPPDVTVDLGIVRDAAHTSLPVTICGSSVGWVRFALTNDIPSFAIDPNGDLLPAVTFLDISQQGSDVPVPWNFALYTRTGHLVANGVSKAGAGFNGSASNAGGDGPFGGGGTFAQLSFGTAPTRGSTPLTSGQTTLGLTLSNQNGASLPANQYYLAVSVGESHAQGNRYGVRNVPSACHTFAITVNTNNRGPAANCPCDLNGDHVVDDADFVLFVYGYSNLIDFLGDFDLDGDVDDDDFFVFSGKYSAFLCP